MTTLVLESSSVMPLPALSDFSVRFCWSGTFSASAFVSVISASVTKRLASETGSSQST